LLKRGYKQDYKHGRPKTVHHRQGQKSADRPPNFSNGCGFKSTDGSVRTPHTLGLGRRFGREIINRRSSVREA